MSQRHDESSGDPVLESLHALGHVLHRNALAVHLEGSPPNLRELNANVGQSLFIVGLQVAYAHPEWMQAILYRLGEIPPDETTTKLTQAIVEDIVPIPGGFGPAESEENLG